MFLLNKPTTVLVLIMLSISLSAKVIGQDKNSQFFDMLDGRFDVSGYLSENAYGFLPVPIIITDPAVDGGLGMMGLFFHETDKEKDQRLKAMQSADRDAGKYLIPPSVSVAAGAYTGNDSWFAGGGHMGFFKKGRIRYMGGGGYGDVNLDYYGSGNVNLQRPIELKTRASGVFQTLKFKIKESPWFIGVSQRYINANISLNSLGSIDDLLPPDFTDELKRLFNLEVTTSGLGLNLEYDSRDNLFSPHVGYRYTFEQIWYRGSFGSDIDYELFSFQGLNYWKLSQQWRLGLKIESEHARSDRLLPPFATPSINLRGIPAMRYQGDFVAATEAELTWQIDSRWSVLGFTGVGRAANSAADFSDAPSRATKGAGFRYHVARRYGFDMGIDIASGPVETVFYITAGSAWAK
jgi:hypothetical protein